MTIVRVELKKTRKRPASQPVSLPIVRSERSVGGQWAVSVF